MANNAYKNLENQINSIFKNCNTGSIKTRYRYLEACKGFIAFVADKYNLQKFANVSSKHIIAYVEYLKEQELAPATIKTNLAGVRFFHRQSGSKNILIDNSKLELTPREYGKINRAWSAPEIQRAINLAKYHGRSDVAFFVRYSSLFSCRLEEACNIRINDIKDCQTYNELKITGKGGRTRYVQVTTQEQRQLLSDSLKYAHRQRKAGADRLFTDNIKGGVKAKKRSIQNWISNHQSKFIISDRQKYITGDKVRSEKLTAHGLRATFAQNLFKQITAQEPDTDERTARLKVSEQLGHGRIEVTNCYLY